MKFAMCLEPDVTAKWRHALQMGVDHAVVLGSSTGDWRLWDYGQMLALKKRFDDFGLMLSAIEGMVPMDEIKSGGPGRDAELDQMCQIIRNMGALEIPVLCYS